MSWDRNVGLTARDSRGLLVHLLGSPQGRPIMLAIGVLLMIGWLSDASFAVADLAIGRLLKTVGSAWSIPPAWLTGVSFSVAKRVVLASVATLILFGFYRWARRARERYPFTVSVDHSPPKARALILFLSFPGNQAQQETYTALRGDLTHPDTLPALGKASWRMPLEAIRYHLPELEHVVLIGSAGPTGTRACVDDFRDLLDRLLPGHALQVGAVDELVDRVARPDGDVIDLRRGLSFFDPETLFTVVDAVFSHLVAHESLDPADVLIDVTGGTALASVAGASAAGGLFRRFEYVAFNERSEHYEVRTMKPTFGIAAKP